MSPPPLSLAHLTVLQASPPELIRLAAAAGYDFVGLRLARVTAEEHLWPLVEDRSVRDATLAAMEETGVGVLDVELVRLTPDVDLAAFEPMLEAAAALGARHVLTQAHDPEFDRVVERFAIFCDMAAAHGLTSDIEFLTWTDNRDLASTRRLLTAADRPNGGVCIDTLHFDRSGCRADEILNVPPGQIRFAQIADAAHIDNPSREQLIHTAREDRLNPGEGDIDLAAILRNLPAGTPLAIEIPNSTEAARRSPLDRVTRARDALLTILAEIDR